MADEAQETKPNRLSRERCAEISLLIMRCAMRDASARDELLTDSDIDNDEDLPALAQELGVEHSELVCFLKTVRDESLAELKTPQAS